MEELLDMNNGFIEIADAESLNKFLADSNGSAAVLFKHSSTCGVSSRAYDEMSRLEYPVGLVIVQKARALSDEIVKRWQVAHETPQVLIVRDRKVVWDASHFRVKAEVVLAALGEARVDGVND